jgi:hypothetical protein
MKNRILAAAILILPFALFCYFWWSPGAVKMPVAGANQTAQNAAVAKVPAAAGPQVNAGIASNIDAAQPAQNPISTTVAKNIAPAEAPAPLEFTHFAPEIVLGKVAHAIHDYASMFGSNPVGTNPEITAALNGNNPRQAKFINPEAGMRINGNGELVDAWGTPYFFHQLSGTEMEIHSAGPDKKMWTEDDLVAR